MYSPIIIFKWSVEMNYQDSQQLLNQRTYIPGGQMIPSQSFNPYSNTRIQMSNNRPSYGPVDLSQYYPNAYSSYFPSANSSYPYYSYNTYEMLAEAVMYDNDDVPSQNTEEVLRQLALTEEDRDKIDHNTNRFGQTNYWYQENLRKQQEFENYLRREQEYNVILSKMYHVYHGIEFNEEEIKAIYDPFKNNSQYQPIDYRLLSDEERHRMESKMKVKNTYDAVNSIPQYEQYARYLENKRNQTLTKMVDSFHATLGLKPDSECSITTLLSHAGNILRNMAYQKERADQRNAARKYSRNGFRAGLSQLGRPIPILSKDDEYVSPEEILKSTFDRNKRNTQMSIMQDPITKQIRYTSEPVIPSEFEAHKLFLEAVNKMKEDNDINRAGSI